MDGRLLLRIEDLDPVRSRPDLVEAMIADLAWLGLRFDPPVLRQSRRIDHYLGAIQWLAGRGLAYRCFCSRSSVSADALASERVTGLPWPKDPDGASLYPGTCRELAPSVIEDRIAAGLPHTWRLDMEAACRAAPGPHRVEAFGWGEGTTLSVADPARWGDVVIGRRDVPASYHLAVVIDDAAQGVTHVVRGMDLKAATDIHVLLQALLGLDSLCYHHHALIRDDLGDKLAKSRGSQSLADLRAAGWTTEMIRSRLGYP